MVSLKLIYSFEFLLGLFDRQIHIFFTLGIVTPNFVSNILENTRDSLLFRVSKSQTGSVEDFSLAKATELLSIFVELVDLLLEDEVLLSCGLLQRGKAFSDGDQSTNVKEEVLIRLI